MPVYSSHLTIRFYRRDGWKLEDIWPYLLSGAIEDSRVTHDDSEEMSYFYMTVGTRLDMKRLLEEKISTIHRWFSSGESDLRFLEGMNW